MRRWYEGSAKREFALVILVMLVAISSSCQSSAWDGVWTLDKTDSRLIGSSFVIQPLRDGGYQIDTGDVSFRFRCDGKEYPTVANQGLKCLMPNSTTLITSMMNNGKLVSVVRRTLSRDQNSLIQTTLVGGQLNTKNTSTHVYVRMSRSSGFGGAWNDPHAIDREPQLVITSLSNSVLNWRVPSIGEHAALKLDGSPVRLEGLKAGLEITVAAKPEGNLVIATEKRVDGELRSRGSMSLTNDGNSLTIESWQPNAPNARTVLKYVRQSNR